MIEARELFDNEFLVRGLPKKYYVDNNKLLVTAYMDIKGRTTSVDVDGGRCYYEIYISMIRNLRLKYGLPYLAYTTVGMCRSIKAYPIHTPTDDNDFHCSLFDSETDRVMSKAKSMILANNSKYVTEDQILNSDIREKQLIYWINSGTHWSFLMC